ncbi:MAG: hypothetical protein ACPG5T_01455, partial [Endozoicomonas sp.]
LNFLPSSLRTLFSDSLLVHSVKAVIASFSHYFQNVTVRQTTLPTGWSPPEIAIHYSGHPLEANPPIHPTDLIISCP